MPGMTSLHRPRTAAALATACVAVTGATLVPAAFAGPEEDLTAVFQDYRPDRDVTPCKFTQAQLEGVRGLLSGDVDAYAPDFGTEVGREITRWTNGGCRNPSLAKPPRGKLRVTHSGGGYAVRTGDNVVCPVGGATCKATIRATSKIGGRTRTVGSTSFTVKSGTQRAVAFKLNKTGAKQLRTKRKLRTKVAVSIKRGTQTLKRSSSFTLKRPK